MLRMPWLKVEKSMPMPRYIIYHCPISDHLSVIHPQAAGQDKLASARSAVVDAEVRARQAAVDQYNDAKATLEHKYAEGKATADHKVKEAKSGWFSWWRWGNTQADETKRRAAGKAAEMAEEARKEADKHSSG